MGQPRRKSSYSPHEHHQGRHRFEHWYVDNQVYFITARCADRFPAFRSESWGAFMPTVPYARYERE